MGPKVEAACRFAQHAGRRAYIGSLDHVSEILAGSAGTMVVRDALP
jgi:carbamate kinase